MVPDAEAGPDLATGEQVFFENFGEPEPGGFERELMSGGLHEGVERGLGSEGATASRRFGRGNVPVATRHGFEP